MKNLRAANTILSKMLYEVKIIFHLVRGCKSRKKVWIFFYRNRETISRASKRNVMIGISDYYFHF